MRSPISQSGQVLPLLAICLATLMGFAGLAVDVGYVEYYQQEQQTATDAAAVAGALQLAKTSCSGSLAAQSAAQSDAATNGFTSVGNVAVYASSPPSSGPYANNSCAISIQITSAHVATFFARLFGYSQGMSETTQALGVAASNGAGCIYLLSPTVSSTFNGDTVNAPGCGILINDTATFNGDPKFGAPYIGYAGGSPTENGTTFTLATPAPMEAVSDPCPEIPGCAYLTANPPATNNCVSKTYNGLGTAVLTPTCYSSLTVNGCTNVVFSPGTYIFNGTTTINGEQSVSGSNVTLYVTGNGSAPTFNGIGSLALSPPSTGNYQGVLYYESPSSTQNPIFNGTTQNFSGLIYAPRATGAIFNGTQGGYTVIVVGAATFNGSAAYDVATPPPGQSLVNEATLAQ